MTHTLKVTLTEAPMAGVGGPIAAPNAITAGPLALSGEKTANGLAQLVLILIRLLHELLERQAMRRAEAGQLSDDELDRVGQTLMQQAAEIERLAALLDLKMDDLNLDLGPLGRLFD
jgi:Gas vesicle protein K